MTAFDQAWAQIGRLCNACGVEHYNQSDFCSKCGQTENKLRESGAYRQKFKTPYQHTGKPGAIPRDFYTGDSYEIECSVCGNREMARAKHHSRRCCGQRMRVI